MGANGLRELYTELLVKYSAAKAEAQAVCTHAHVLHDDGFRSFGTYKPQRRCSDCGLTEIGGWWCYAVDSCWHLEGWSSAPMLGSKEGRTITPADDKTFSGAYVP